MKHIIIKKTPYGYSCGGIKDTRDGKLEILADWFLHDVSNRLETWFEWLNDNSYEETDSNATWLEKEINTLGEQEILFGSLAHMIDNSKKGLYKPKESDFARLSKKNVIELLNTWQQLLQTRPNEIMITEENGIYKMFAVQ